MCSYLSGHMSGNASVYPHWLNLFLPLQNIDLFLNGHYFWLLDAEPFFFVLGMLNILLIQYQISYKYLPTYSKSITMLHNSKSIHFHTDIIIIYLFTQIGSEVLIQNGVWHLFKIRGLFKWLQTLAKCRICENWIWISHMANTTFMSSWEIILNVLLWILRQRLKKWNGIGGSRMNIFECDSDYNKIEINILLLILILTYALSVRFILYCEFGTYLCTSNYVV